MWHQIEQLFPFLHGNIHFVDGRSPRASDEGPGTFREPWKTLTHTTKPGILSPGDLVVVRGGTYREALRPSVGGQPDALIGWMAYPGEEVVITGSDVAQPGGWTEVAHGLWRHPWVWRKLPSLNNSYTARMRGELVAADGRVLLQRGGQSRPDLQPYEFWVEGVGAGTEAVYAMLPGDPNQMTIEVGQRDLLFGSVGDREGGEVSQGYYFLKGLKFQHSTALRQRMAVVPGKFGSVVEDVETSWNNAGGIKIIGHGHTLRRVKANHNGIEGWGGTGAHGCLFEDVETNYNCWKDPGGDSWHGGGGKWTRSVSNRFVRIRSAHNYHIGLWFDINNEDNEIDRSLIEDNFEAGVYIELNSNGNYLANSIICGTRYSRDFMPGVGVGISCSERNVLVHVTMANNAGGGLMIFGDNRGRSVENVALNCLLQENLAEKADCPGNAREIVVSGWAGKISVAEALANAQTNALLGCAVVSPLAGTAAPSNGWRALYQLSPDPVTTKTAYHNDAAVIEVRLPKSSGNVVLPPDAFDEGAPPEGLSLFDLVGTGALTAEQLERVERLMREDYRSWDRLAVLHGPVPVGAKRPPKRKKAA